MKEKCINRDFPVSSAALISYACAAVSYGYDPKEKDNAKRLFIPPNPCEVLLIKEYYELADLWNTFLPLLTFCYDRLTDNTGKGAPTKSWLELDARYCMALYDYALDVYPEEAFNQVKKYLVNQLNIFSK
jgi:hypothetical protein